MASLQQQIELLHKSLIEKFTDLKEENKLIEVRLKNIESTLNNGNKDQEEETFKKVSNDDAKKGEKSTRNDSNKKPSEKTREKSKKKSKPTTKSNTNRNNNKIEKVESAEEDEDFDQNESYKNMGNLDDFENMAMEDKDDSKEALIDDGFRHDVETKSMPNKLFEGHTFRPVTGWRNKNGNFEISKEIIEFSESKIILKMIGRDTEEEIARLSFSIKEIEKVEAYFDEKTVLNIFGAAIFDATQQILQLTSLKSYSLVDENVLNKIRITFDQVNEEDCALVQEYFRKNAVYFKVTNLSSLGEMYFKKLNFRNKSKVEETSCVDVECREEDLEEMIHCIKTFQYLDKQLYSCKLCEYLSDNNKQMKNHVYNLHIVPKRRMSEQDIVINYIE